MKKLILLLLLTQPALAHNITVHDAVALNKCIYENCNDNFLTYRCIMKVLHEDDTNTKNNKEGVEGEKPDNS